MTRRRTTALALAAALAVPTSAAADPPVHNHLVGGCSATNLSPSPDAFHGQLHAAAVAYALWHQHDPVTITRLTCEVRVSGTGVLMVEGETAGPAAFVAPRLVSFPMGFDDWVEVCTVAEVVDAHGQRDTLRAGCDGTTPEMPFPPHPLNEALDHVVWPTVDPLACAAFQALAPVVPPPVTITPGGDVYAAGELLWDCPPYA